MNFKSSLLGNIPSHWDMKPLSECTEKITDGTHSTVKDIPNGESYLLSCKNIKEGNIVLGNKERKIDKKTLLKLRERTGLQKNDILLTTVGTIGESAIISEEDINYEFQRSVAIIRAKPSILLPKFLYYYTKSLRFRSQAEGLTSGSVQKCLFLGNLSKIIIPIPTLEEQIQISNILSSIDKKINLNFEMNKNLEEMAQEIFRRWFIDFEFPNENGAPYKSSGGIFVDSDVGQLPLEWTIKNIDQICDITSSKRIFLKEYVPEGIPFYRSKEVIEKSKGMNISTELYITEEKYEEVKNKFGAPLYGDILLTSVGTLGIPYLVDREKFYFKDGNLTWFKGFKKCGMNLYLFYWLLSKIGKNSLDRITIGSTQKALTITALKKLRIILPSNRILEKFNRLFASIKAQLQSNINQNHTLIEVRDSLILKLISGDIRIPETEKEVEECLQKSN